MCDRAVRGIGRQAQGLATNPENTKDQVAWPGSRRASVTCRSREFHVSEFSVLRTMAMLITKLHIQYNRTHTVSREIDLCDGFY